eukprot:1195156-Prorocentrum_minimum.AAC.1
MQYLRQQTRCLRSAFLFIRAKIASRYEYLRSNPDYNHYTPSSKKVSVLLYKCETSQRFYSSALMLQQRVDVERLEHGGGEVLMRRQTVRARVLQRAPQLPGQAVLQRGWIHARVRWIHARVRWIHTCVRWIHDGEFSRSVEYKVDKIFQLIHVKHVFYECECEWSPAPAAAWGAGGACTPPAAAALGARARQRHWSCAAVGSEWAQCPPPLARPSAGPTAPSPANSPPGALNSPPGALLNSPPEFKQKSMVKWVDRIVVRI